RSVLDTVPGENGHRLYLRAGWTQTGLVPNYALFPDGRLCDTAIMWKRLDRWFRFSAIRLAVVPAKAGTHTPCSRVRHVASCLPYNRGRWLWVPAFAGTTN